MHHQRNFSLLREKISSDAGSYGYIGSSSGIVDGIAHHYHQATSVPKAACGPIRGPLGDGYRAQQQLQQQQQSILGSNDHHQACRGDNHKENDEVICGTSGNGVRKGVRSFGVERDGGACYGDYGDNNYNNGNVGDVLRSLPGTDYIQQQQHW